MLTRTLQQWIDLFNKINEDCAATDADSVVPLTDFEYYSHQIDNLTDGIDYEQALARSNKGIKVAFDVDGLTVENTGCDGSCHHCGSTEIRVLNRFQKHPRTGYHVECNACEAFWDEYPVI